MKKAIQALLRRIFGPLFFAATLVVATALACAPPPAAPTIVNVNVTNVTTVTLNLAGGGIPSSVPGCPAISKIRVGYPDVLPRNQKANLSATPLDSEGKPRKAECDDDAGITWTFSPTQLVTIADRNAFDTTITAGSTAGPGTLTVDIGAGGSNKGVTNSFQVTVS